MTGNSPFRGWEIPCLGNTELNVSPPGPSWADIVGGGYSQGEEGGTSLGKASTFAVVLSATVEYLLIQCFASSKWAANVN